MPANPFQDGISVAIQGDSSGLDDALDSASAGLVSFKKKIGLAGGALAALAGGAMAGAINEARKFQSAMVELEKVTDPSTAREMSDSIREMAETIPLAQTELADIAADAGRFGVEGTENIEKFTESTAKMATATDMNASQAGEAFAKLAELTNTPISEVENLGSSINALSNNFATSAQEIVDAMMRASGAMSQFGLSQTDIAGFSAALNAVSESSERAGTRMRRLVQEISNPKKVHDMAAALGMTADEYRNMQENNPRQLLLNMIEGFKEGGRTADELNKNLSTTSRQALAGFSQNLGGLREALGMSADAFEENTSLQKEFDAATDTFNSKLQTTKNRLTNVAITIGNVLLPHLSNMLDVVAGGISKFQDFNEATNGIPVTIGLVATAIGGLVSVLWAFGPSATAVVGALTGIVGAFGSIVTTVAGIPAMIAGVGATFAGLAATIYSTIFGALMALPGAAASAAFALASTLFSALISVGSALVGLPGMIASLALSLGSTLVTAAASAATTLAALPGILAAKAAAMVSVISLSGILSGALGVLSTVAGLATGGVAALTAALATIGAPIAIVIAAVVALYAAWKSNFLGIRDLTSRVVTFLKALFTGDFATIKGQVQNVARSARQFWDNNIKPMVTTARNAIGTIQSAIIAPFLAWFVPIWQKHLGVIKKELAITAQAWLNTISAFIDWARPYVSAFLSDLSAWWGQHGDEVMSIVRPLLNGLKRLFEMAFSIIADIIVGFIRLARGDLSGFKSSVMSIIDTLVSGVVDLFRWLYNRLIGNSIIPNMLSDIISAIRGFKGRALSAGKGLIGAFVRGIKSKIGSVKSSVNSAVQAARDRLPGSDAKEGPLSDLTKSGEALPETFAEGIESNLRTVRGASMMTAQAASPTAQAQAGGTNITVNVDARGATDPDAVGTAVADQLRSVLSR